MEHETEDQRIHVVELYFLSTNQSTRSGFIRGFNKMAEAEGSLKYGFQERCVSSLFFFYGGSVFIRCKEFVLVSALVYHPRPHQSFVAISDFFSAQFFSCFAASAGI